MQYIKIWQLISTKTKIFYFITYSFTCSFIHRSEPISSNQEQRVLLGGGTGAVSLWSIRTESEPRLARHLLHLLDWSMHGFQGFEQQSSRPDWEMNYSLISQSWVALSYCFISLTVTTLSSPSWKSYRYYLRGSVFLEWKHGLLTWRWPTWMSTLASPLPALALGHMLLSMFLTFRLGGRYY